MLWQEARSRMSLQSAAADGDGSIHCFWLHNTSMFEEEHNAVVILVHYHCQLSTDQEVVTIQQKKNARQQVRSH